MADRQTHGAVAESKAPPLTIERVYEAIKGVKNWRDFGTGLGLLLEQDAIESQYGSDDLRVKAVVEKFLRGESLLYPHPSWRVVIQTLDNMNEIYLTDQIIDYGEPVQDPTLVTANVAEAMQLINDWRSLGLIYMRNYVIPPWRLEVIQSKYFTKRETANECAFYYVHCHPRPSWTHLANQLYSQGEFAAVEELKPFLPLRDLTITTKKLTELFVTLKDDLLDLLGFLLDLPEIKADKIKKNFHSPSQRREAYLDLYATDHPIPTWSQVAGTLRTCGLPSQAGMVEKTYVQGVLQLQYLIRAAYYGGREGHSEST